MSDVKILYMLLLELKNAVNKLKENNKIINIMHYAIVHYLFIQWAGNDALTSLRSMAGLVVRAK